MAMSRRSRPKLALLVCKLRGEDHEREHPNASPSAMMTATFAARRGFRCRFRVMTWCRFFAKAESPGTPPRRPCSWTW